MADSKISQLPLSPYILDKDLIVVVTGHLEEGSYPQNVKVPLSYIRRYIVRLNLITNQVSGIDSYYHSGLNILTTWTTGIHAVPGNNIEVQFDGNSPAGIKYGQTGPICHSGIISVTGLNAYGGNRIHTDIDADWPYSGIVHTTGLNMLGGSGIGYQVATEWPHEYKIISTEKIKQGSIVTVSNNNDQFISSVSGFYNLIDLNYNDFYQSKANQNIKLIGTAVFKINNITFNSPSYVPGVGSTNERKQLELSSRDGSTTTWNYYTCDNPPTAILHTDGSHTFQTGDFPYFQPNSWYYVNNTFTLTIGISGGNSNNFINSIHTYPITFQNSNGPNANDCSEIYRSGIGKDIFNSINYIDPIIIREPISLIINSSNINSYNTFALCAKISNVQYVRNYSYILGQSYDCNSTSDVTYSYNTTNTYASTQAIISCQFLKGENIVY